MSVFDNKLVVKSSPAFCNINLKINERILSFQIEEITATKAIVVEIITTRSVTNLTRIGSSFSSKFFLLFQERDKYHTELLIARKQIENIDKIIAENVKNMKAKLEEENSNSINELKDLR